MQVNISVDRHNSEYFVTASFPIELDHSPFKSAFLLKGSDWNKPLLLVPLKTTTQDKNKNPNHLASCKYVIA